jgi:AcrR family transcriptional regulator
MSSAEPARVLSVVTEPAAEAARRGTVTSLSAAQRTRGRILQATRELVAERGVNHLTLDAVVARAGLSKGALLYHFKTKRDLLVALIAALIAAFEQDQAQLEQGFAGDPDPWLSSQVTATPDAEAQAIGAALLAAIAEDPSLLEPVRAWYRAYFARARQSPRGADEALLVLLALEGSLWLDMLALPGPDPVERRRLMRLLQSLAAGDLQLVPARTR